MLNKSIKIRKIKSSFLNELLNEKKNSQKHKQELLRVCNGELVEAFLSSEVIHLLVQNLRPNSEGGFMIKKSGSIDSKSTDGNLVGRSFLFRAKLILYYDEYYDRYKIKIERFRFDDDIEIFRVFEEYEVQLVLDSIDEVISDLFNEINFNEPA